MRRRCFYSRYIDKGVNGESVNDRNNNEQERFSLDEIIAEVKGTEPPKPVMPEEELDPVRTFVPRQKPKEESRPPDKEAGADTAEADAHENEAAGDGDAARGQEDEQPDNAEGERPEVRENKVLSFFRKKAPPAGSPAGEDTGELPPYPVSDEELPEDEEQEYVEEDAGEEEDTQELAYDFLNIPYDNPTYAVKRLTGQIRRMSVRLIASLVIFLISGYITLSPQFAVLPQIPWPQGSGLLPGVVLLTLQALAMLMCFEVMHAGVWRIFKLRPTLDSLVVFSGVCIALGGAAAIFASGSEMPLCMVSNLTCLAALSAKRSRAHELRRIYKCMELGTGIQAVKLGGSKKSPLAFKTERHAFVEHEEVCSQNLTERSSQIFAPFVMVTSVALAAAASFGKGQGGGFVWALAVISSVTAPVAFIMSSVRPSLKIAQKLFSSGAAIIGYSSAARLAKAKRVLIVDNDLFPKGSVRIAGMKSVSSIPMEHMLAATAAVLSDVGGGLSKAFNDLAREQYLVPKRALNVQYFEGGGISGQVGGDYILIGSCSFLERMGIMVQEGHEIKEGVFVGINSVHTGIFTLKYVVQPQAHGAMGIFSRFGIGCEMALKDFNVTSKMVAERMAVKKSLILTPTLEAKEYYWDGELGADSPCEAFILRDTIIPFAEVLGGAKSLMKSIRLNLFCSYACAGIGMVTMYFLAAMQKASLASPANIITYLLLWYVPVWLSGFVVSNY